MRKFIILAFICGLLPWPVTAQAPQHRPSLSLRISAPQTVKSGSPLQLRITLANNNDHDVSYVVGSSPTLNMHVLDFEGKPAPETEYGRHIHPWNQTSGSVVGFREHLGPHKTIEAEQDVTKEYDLGGKFTIYVEGPPEYGTREKAKSNLVTVEVIK